MSARFRICHDSSATQKSITESISSSFLPIQEDTVIDDPAPTKKLLNMKEAADFLRFSRSHLSNAIHGKLNGTPRLPCVRIGRRVLFRLEALEEWLRQIQTNSDSSFHLLVRHPK
jgi:excisionase family DNA binding protein